MNLTALLQSVTSNATEKSAFNIAYLFSASCLIMDFAISCGQRLAQS